jgi:hypothetical protein
VDPGELRGIRLLVSAGSGEPLAFKSHRWISQTVWRASWLRDDGACVERAADSLHRAGGNAKLLGDLPYTRSPRSC